MDSNLMIMSREMESHSFGFPELVVNPYAILAVITSGCIVARIDEFLLQSFLLQKIQKIQIAGDEEDQSKFPKIVAAEPKILDHGVTGVDVKNYDDLKLVQNAGKSKKGGKKEGKGKTNKEAKNTEQEKAAQRKKEEEERLRKWNDDWNKRLDAQEALDQIPCCSADGLVLKPKTQSNVWIKVTQDKMIQDVQMAFMHVPVARPKAPPLPKLLKEEPRDPVPLPAKTTDKGKQKKVSRKKK